MISCGRLGGTHQWMVTIAYWPGPATDHSFHFAGGTAHRGLLHAAACRLRALRTPVSCCHRVAFVRTVL